MKNRKLFSSELFLALLPFYFALHGYRQNREAMSVAEALGLFAPFALVALVLAALFFWPLKSWRKAAVFSFCLLGFYLFFGALHDAMKGFFPSLFLSQYSFVLPAAGLCFVVVFIYLKRTKSPLLRLAAYLNLLFVLLCLLELPALLKKLPEGTQLSTLSGAVPCDTCTKPDIYFIIADEYADSASLQQIFGFNNGAFQDSLRNRGFHVVANSRANYNFTPFAVASLLGMNYLSGLEGHNKSLADKNRCYDAINRSGLWSFLHQEGYEIKNHSVFNVANIPSPAPHNYIVIGKDNVLAQTLYERFNRDLRFHLSLQLKWQSEIDRILYFEKRCNDLLLHRLLNETESKATKPRFVYTHLTMPHYPYYFRKDGRPNPPQLLTEGNQGRKPEYLEYLQWSNGVFLQAIDRILSGSAKPPVIVFMGDHGFREFAGDFEKWSPYYFMNLNAVLLPSKNYSGFYEGISGVNQLRAVLNSVFAQRLPVLKDSSVLLRE